MFIKKISGVIIAVNDLSETAREVVISLSEPLNFVAGCFVNVFIEDEGVILRRAFSISSADTESNMISISVRLNPNGAVTPLFWRDNIVGKNIEVMGPLGLNTADKMKSSRIFLFGFGVGAGVVKSLAEHFVAQDSVTSLVIITGNRSATDILHKDYFDDLVNRSDKTEVTYVVSEADLDSVYLQGYIQDHIKEINFDNSDVYVCGQEVACSALVSTVKNSQPTNASYFVEAFH